MYQSLLLGYRQFVIDADVIKFDSHWHSEIEVAYCLAGSFNMKINNKNITVKKGQAVFVGSAEEHEYLGSENNTKVLIIEFGISFLESEFTELSALQFVNPLINIEKPDVLTKTVASKFKETFYSIVEIKSGSSDSVADNWFIKSALYNIAALIIKYIPHKVLSSDIRKVRMKSILNIQPAISYVINNYSSSISIDDVASLTGYERSNFCKQFKAATKVSFHKYLNTYRIGVACNLLESDEYSIQTIGEMVGIPEAKSFSRIFKQIMGMKPTEYRNMKIKKKEI